MLHEDWAIPSTTRSKVVLEIASHIVGSDQALSQAKVSLRKQGTDEWPVCLLASDTPRAIAAVRAGEIDAIFDEAAQEWIDVGIDAGMTIASLPEAAISKLEAMGYRGATIRRDDYPKLPGDVRTIDFSGWAIYVHADLSDD